MKHLINFANCLANIVADPGKYFNACDNFIIFVVTCHIIIAAIGFRYELS